MKHRLLFDSLLPDVLESFPKHFECLPFNSPDALEKQLQQDDIVLCRSTLKIPTIAMRNHKPRLIATASSGSDNFDKGLLKQLEIPFLDARGCNKESVADFALCCLAILKKMHGTLPSPIGIVGLGAVGSAVAERFSTLGLDLVLFDPLRASQETHFISHSESKLLQCPIIFLHANLHHEAPFATYHWLNTKRLASLADGSILVNLARGALIDEAALYAEIPRISFISDVFEHEPNISKDMVSKSLFCTPHIAGHSLEGKRQAVRILSEKIHALLGLSEPHFKPFESIEIDLPWQSKSWEDACLAVYDPRVESNILKSSTPECLSETFLTLRTAHTFRHDFSCIAGFHLNKGSP